MLAAWASHTTLTGSSTARRVAEVCGRALLEGVDYLACRAALLADAGELVERALAHEPAEPATGDDGLVELAIRSQLALARGDLSDAEANARTALAELEGLPLTALRRRVRSDLLADLVLLALERTQYGEAHQLLGELEDADGPVAACLRIALALAQSAPAADLALEVEQAPVGVIAPGVSWRPLAALAHHAAGDGSRAMTLAADHLEHARAWGGPSVLGRALLVRAVVGEGTERLSFAEDAVAVLERSSARLELARATVELGTALRRARRRRESREQLVRGADLAHRCGAEALVAHARAELVSVGARPRRAAFSGVSSLTASELRVARLAAAGLTNREIAQALTVSVKTVSGQLTAVYRKLDIHDRAALAAAMQGEPEPVA
jgi:DNA-binding CsgD family transcriptional regulator